MGSIEGVRKILDVKVDSEAWVVVTGKHHRSLCIENSGTCEAATDCLIYELRISTSLLCEGQCLCDDANVGSHDHLDCKLCNVTGAKRSYIYDRTSHDHEHVIVLVEGLLLTTDHNGKGSVDGLWLTTGYRSIEHIYAELLEVSTDLLRLYRVDGRHIDEYGLTLTEALCEAVLVKYSGTYVWRVRNHGDDNICELCKVLTAGTCLCAGSYELIDGSLIEIKYHQLVTSLEQVLCHRSTHDTKS